MRLPKIPWRSVNALLVRLFPFRPNRANRFLAVCAIALFFGAPSFGPQRRVLSPIPADEFVQAIKNQRTPLINLYLVEHLDPNARASQDRPLIVAAAMEQDWETVRGLLKAGACPDLADTNGTTALIAAAMHGQIDILRELIGKVTSVDSVDRSGRSALHYAIAAGQTSAVEFLLPFTPDLRTNGSAFLGLALNSGDDKIADDLLERMPLLQHWSPSAQCFLARSLAVGDRRHVSLLLKKHAVQPTAQDSRVPLLAYAIATDDAVLFNTLLNCGADPNTVLPERSEDKFLALLESKRLRNDIDGDKNVTVLMLAAGLGQSDYVKALLDAGADRQRATTRYRALPLHMAAQNGHWRCAQLLLGTGPSPEQLRIEISLASQKVALIKHGVPVFNTTCSTGRDGFATRAGDYIITDKDRYHRSTIYKVEMPYFMRLSCFDFGMHEGYVPGHRASHGCIRLPGDAARMFFAEIPVGTLVSVK